MKTSVDELYVSYAKSDGLAEVCTECGVCSVGTDSGCVCLC